MKQKTLKQLINCARDFATAVNTGKPKELLLAQDKRRMEKNLQKQGLSRSHAQAIVADRFRNRQSTLHI